MVSKVRGRFDVVGGTVTIDEDTSLSDVDATIDATSVNSGDAKRDEHLRGDDFFGVAEFPTITFRSTAVDDHGDGTFTLTGDLTIRPPRRRSCSRRVPRHDANAWARPSSASAAETEVSRKQWGLDWNAASRPAVSSSATRSS